MGKIAAEFCDEIILTNEDPYDENPLTILKDVESGFSQIQNSQHKILNKYEARRVNYKLIVDRREAIRAAISQAQPSDVVVITGKGCEPWLMGPNGTKIPWDDRKTARDILRQAF